MITRYLRMLFGPGFEPQPKGPTPEPRVPQAPYKLEPPKAQPLKPVK